MRAATATARVLVVLSSTAGITGIASGDDVAQRIAGAALAGGGAHDLVRSLADEVGARPAGSPGAQRATVWAEAAMRRIGLKKVRRQEVKVRIWTRGEESAALVAPVSQPLLISTLGGSVATPPEGLVAEVVETDSLDGLRALGAQARGKIVLVNKPMERTRDGHGYGAAAPVRARAASEAARLGAVAALVRSAGTGYHRLAHTGAMRYEEGVSRIPTAALAAEDADLLHRMLQGGAKVSVRLRLMAQTGGEAPGWNVIGEVPGRHSPEEIVLIGAHLDSWDVGTGALDDGAGCAIALDSARVILGLGQRPRRTVRVVLFSNEEMGIAGARGYAEAHQAELPRHVAAMEADAGAGRPWRYQVVGGAGAIDLVRKWVRPLARLVPADVYPDTSAGTDINPLIQRGVPALEISQDMTDYFDWHHTAGDTFDKIDPLDLAIATAAFASLTWAAADAPERLPRPAAKP